MNKTFTMIRDYLKLHKIMIVLLSVVVALDVINLTNSILLNSFESLSIDPGFIVLMISLFLATYLISIRKTEKAVKTLNDYLMDNDAEILNKNAESLKLSLFSKDFFWVVTPLYAVVSMANVAFSSPAILFVTYILNSVLFVFILVSSAMANRYANDFISSMSEDLLRKALNQISSGGDDE
jgi:hypothetical protein